ncbi:glycosyltransferase family 4 protein [Phenylobacterium sp. LjRoot219]|uniref:glycosyltransferase family 4 protein n=1 Tax=Phenylobacterium sp. LjRoot219 TaxID=3342283 RepID=UPI003ED16F01
MKVLHVLPFPGVGGTEIATRRIADAVRPYGVHSAALLLQPTADQLAYFEEAGVPCFADLRRPEPSLVREAAAFLRDSWATARICGRFDLVHCADVSAAYHVGVAGRMAQRPVLCHVRNREAQIGRRSRIFIGAASHFAFVSQDTRERFPIPIPQQRSSVLYDGVEIAPPAAPAAREATARAVRAEFGLPQDTVIAAMFARVNPQKDYQTLIRAAALLRDAHPQLRFLIVGDNANVPLNRQHFEQVQAQARDAGVLDRFVFAGFRSDTERLMLAADLCVLCTHFEGLPLVVIEAMAAGRPCVATAVDGVPETLTDGETGLLHAHEDAAGLAAALARLIEGRDLAARIGANARAEAERRFSRQRFARDVTALYRRLQAAGTGLASSSP